MTIKIKQSHIIPTLILSVAFVTKWRTHNVDWYFPYMMTIPVMLFACVFKSKRWDGKTFANVRRIIGIMILPYLISFVYSLMLQLGAKLIINSLMRAISLTIQYAYVLCLVGVLFLTYGAELIDLVNNAMILAYLYILVAAYFGIGIGGMIEYCTSFWAPEIEIYYLGRWFEIHDIGLSVGMLLLYNLFIRKDKNVFQTFCLMVIMILCYKRIAILAFFLVAAGSVIVNLNEGRGRDKAVSFFLLIMPVVYFGYIFIVSSGLLYYITERFGIDFSGRTFVFNHMRRFYTFSPLFLGRGMGFTEKYLTSIHGTNIGRRVGNYGYMHNDIVKMFIDYGFWGCIFWFVWLFWVVSSNLKKWLGPHLKFVYCMLINFAFIVYMTDNATRYFDFQTVFFAVLLVSSL